jgi:predicted transcriptional regulator
MPESETEHQILDRIEAALRKIAVATETPRPVLNRAALVQSLDMLIARLRAGLEQPKSGDLAE